MPATPNLEALLAFAPWGAGNGTPLVVTYSFAAEGGGGFGLPLAAGHWAPFSAAQQASAREALARWAAVCGVQFVEVPDTVQGLGVDLRFRLEDLGSLSVAGETYFPPSGNIALSLVLFAGDTLAPSPSRVGFTVLLHEIGHALGLKHPWDGDIKLDAALQNTDTTVMAYEFGRAGVAQAPRALDALAVQEMYGAPGASAVSWRWDEAGHMVVGQGTLADEVLAAPALGAVLAGGGGADTLVGGAGLDTALFQVTRAEAAVELGAGVVTTPGGTAWFSGVEALAFTDGHLALDAADPAAVLARLYAVALGRAPDTPGLVDWLARVQAGLSLHDAAALFLQSPEYLAAHAGLDDAGFAALLATHGGGLAVAAAQLQAGWDRGAVLLAAANADPVKAATDGLLAEGLWVPIGDGAEVARLYQLVLGRAPDAPGWAHWVGAMQAGESLDQVARDFLGSVEFGSAHAGASAMATLDLALARLAGSVDAAAWEARLDAGAAVSALLAELAEGPWLVDSAPWVTAGGIVFA